MRISDWSSDVCSSDLKTVSYIAAQFEAAGLKPGNGESWYQDVPLVEITATSKPALTVTGGDQRLTFAYQTDMMAGTRPAVPKRAEGRSVGKEWVSKCGSRGLRDH